MKKQMFTVWAELTKADEFSPLNPGDEKNVDNSDNQAFYFLTIMLILMVTFSLFKGEILRLLFSWETVREKDQIINYKLLIINYKWKLCPADGFLTASGGDSGLPPEAVLNLARRAQILFIIYNLSFIVYNFLFSDSLLGACPRIDKGASPPVPYCSYNGISHFSHHRVCACFVIPGQPPGDHLFF